MSLTYSLQGVEEEDDVASALHTHRHRKVLKNHERSEICRTIQYGVLDLSASARPFASESVGSSELQNTKPFPSPDPCPDSQLRLNLAPSRSPMNTENVRHSEAEMYGLIWCLCQTLWVYPTQRHGKIRLKPAESWQASWPGDAFNWGCLD
jgi:hypothetical protein